MDKITFLLPAGIRLDQFLTSQLTDYSRSFIQKLIKGHKVCNQEKVLEKVSFTAKHDVEINVSMPKPKINILKKTDGKVEVIFENDEFAIINKPSGMTVHPGAGTGEHADTLAHILNSQFENLSSNDELWDRPGIVHRLDRDTSGLMVIAKTNKAHNSFSTLFRERNIIKIYRCWIWNQNVITKGDIDGFIFRDPTNRKLMRFSKDPNVNEGKNRNASLEILKVETKECFKKLLIQLKTGRTHQIRATLNYFNSPLINDRLYGNHKSLAKINKFSQRRLKEIQTNGLALQACELAFEYEINGKLERFHFKLEPTKRLLHIESLFKD